GARRGERGGRPRAAGDGRCGDRGGRGRNGRRRRRLLPGFLPLAGAPARPHHAVPPTSFAQPPDQRPTWGPMPNYSHPIAARTFVHPALAFAPVDPGRSSHRPGAALQRARSLAGRLGRWLVPAVLAVLLASVTTAPVH